MTRLRDRISDLIVAALIGRWQVALAAIAMAVLVRGVGWWVFAGLVAAAGVEMAIDAARVRGWWQPWR